jgi:type VI secretion system protein ImpG
LDPRLLEYYNRELTYLRELGGEFAQQYPKVAGRLGMQGIDVADPYVERLIEGFSFLSARIQLKMDAEFPRFSQRLTEVVYPNFLAPMPSACVVQMKPAAGEGSQGDAYTLPRGSRMRSRLPSGVRTACEFRTTQEVTLWPLELAEAQLTGIPADVPLAKMGLSRPPKAALRLRFAFTGAVGPKGLALERLPLFLSGPDDLASKLYELILGHSIAVLQCGFKQPVKPWRVLADTALQAEGFDDDQALLPYATQAFQGYRLLHEYFAFPQKYAFISVGDLLRGMPSAAAENGFELVFLLDRSAAELEPVVDKHQFALHCTPAVNLLSRRTDRISLAPDRYEYHLVVDRACPLDYEVYAVSGVEGFGADSAVATHFRPFYSTLAGDRGDHGAYYSMRREPRIMSESARRHGTRTTYVGSEVFLSLVDQHEAPFSSDLRQLGVELLATNRDLPLIMPLGGDSDFTLMSSAPVASVKVLRGPSKPTPSVAEAQITWRLISHLGLNYVTLTDTNPEEGARALRELFELYSAMADPAIARHGQAVLSASIKPLTRRLPGAGPLVFGRGVGIEVKVDETLFAGFSPYLLGAVIERFLARHVGINVFTETSIHSAQRGKVGAWPPRFGKRPAI